MFTARAQLSQKKKIRRRDELKKWVNRDGG